MLCFICMLSFPYFCLVCGWLFFSRRRRVQVIDENAVGCRIALGGHLCDSIRIGVFLPWDVVELQTPESPFQPADFLAACVHERALAVGVLHDLVDYQLGVAIDVKASCPDVDGYAEAANECLILCYVVGCREVEADRVLELTSFCGD